MTRDELDAIRQRVEAATPGPWAVSSPSSGHGVTVGHRMILYATIELALPDAEFIAHARSDIPALLDEIALLRQQLKDAYTTLDSSSLVEPIGA